MAALSRGRRRHAENESRFRLAHHLLEAERRDMVTLVHDHLTAVRDQVADLLVARVWSGLAAARRHVSRNAVRTEGRLGYFQAMLAENALIETLVEHRLTRCRLVEGAASRRIQAAEFSTSSGVVELEAAVYIDASYEGDRMAAAGVEYHVGREGRDDYDESLAPPVADGQLQGYNFRLIATREESLRVTPTRPPGYRREDYVDIPPLFADGRLERVFGYPDKCVYKARIPRLPNAKYDINDVSNGPVRLSLPGENLGWPDGDPATRRRIFDEHLRWNVGLLWFLQHDEAVPARFRDEAREWGWCADEFVETDHLPPQLYVREARRMVGLRVYTENDTRDAPRDARAILHRDAVAMGEYSHNCHGTGHEGPRVGGRHAGEFYKVIAPYQVPYGTLVPRNALGRNRRRARRGSRRTR